MMQKLDYNISRPFQWIVDSLQRNGRDASAYLFTMSIIMTIMFVVAIILQTIANIIIGLDNIDPQHASGMASLTILTGAIDILAFFCVLGVFGNIYHKTQGQKDHFIGQSVVFEGVEYGTFLGFVLRVLAFHKFISVIIDFSHVGDMYFIWHIIYNNHNSPLYMLGVIYGWGLLFGIISLVLFSLSWFFMGCKFSKPKAKQKEKLEKCKKFVQTTAH